MALVGQHHQADGAAQSLDGVVHPLRLHGEGPGVVVDDAVGQQQRFVDLLRVHEGRHPEVHLRGLPEASALVLEAEGREAAIECAAAGDAGGEVVGVGEHVGGHEGAVAVPGDADSVPVGNPHLHELVHGGLAVRHQLLHIAVIGGEPPDDRHRRVVEHGIPLRQQQEMRRAGDGREAVGGPPDLSRALLVGEFAGIGPHEHGKALAGFMAGGEIQFTGQGDAVVALVVDLPLGDAGELGLGVGEGG